MSTNLTLFCLFLLSIIYFKFIRYPKKFNVFNWVHVWSYLLAYMLTFTHSLKLSIIIATISLILSLTTIIRGNMK